MSQISESPESKQTPKGLITRRALFGAAGLAAVGFVTYKAFNNTEELFVPENYTPSRIAPDNGQPLAPTESASPSTTNSIDQAPESATSISSSSPKKLLIPSVGITAQISSAINPSPVKEHGIGMGYDPPTMGEVYWAEGCAMPSRPSKGTTYLFGHSNRYTTGQRGVFDNLQELEKKDKITIITKLGRFTYKVTANLLLPFSELDDHADKNDFGDGNVPDRAVLITCHIPGGNADYDGNTVVIANLDSAESL